MTVRQFPIAPLNRSLPPAGGRLRINLTSLYSGRFTPDRLDRSQGDRD